MTITSGIDWTASSYEEVTRRHRWSIPERLNIAHVACDRHATGDGRIALIAVDESGETTSHSFDELKDLSDRFASVLAARGVSRGDRVAVFLPQRLENAVAHLAAFKVGAMSVPLSPLFRADALEYRVRHSKAKVIITDAEHEEHLGACAADIIDCDASFRSLVASAAPMRALDTLADDPAMVVYTSGTSGLPKGAVHAHRFIPGRLSGFELMHRIESRPSRERPFWTPADWAWVGGLVDCVFTPWVFGSPVLGWRRRGFDPEAVLAFVTKHRVRSLFLPPTALNRMRSVLGSRSRVDVESVHTAGEPLSPEAYAWAKDVFCTVYELYGMTEMGATIGNTPFFEVRPGSMGKPLPGHIVTLLREDGTEANDGEIAIRRGDPGMFLGYLDDPDATAARFRGDWFVTGDLAARDEDGWLHYRGRSDDVFNTAGYRVGPTEIEQSLLSHPAVEHAAVVGEKDDERGEIVKAFLVLRPRIEPSEALAAEIQRHVKGRLAAYEYPRRIVFARELPMTPSGKVRRVLLRAPDADERYGLFRRDT
jgi:acetyl-CoA synthetase